MQFAIPQFIEVEDKVIGPLTVRQFIFLVIGGVLMVIYWSLADLGLFIVLALITAAVVVAFAFVKVNGRSFQIFLIAFLQFNTRPRLRTWYRETGAQRLKTSLKKKNKIIVTKEEEEIYSGGKRLVRSQLEHLSSILDQSATEEFLNVQNTNTK